MQVPGCARARVVGVRTLRVSVHASWLGSARSVLGRRWWCPEINAGLNTGRAILHSGTVGAALTAQNFGAKGLAVSVAAAEPWRWETAATIAIEVLDLLIVCAAPVSSEPSEHVPASGCIGEVESDGTLQIELRATNDELPTDTDTALCEAGSRR